MYYIFVSGVVFDQNTDEIQNAFKFAMLQHSNANKSHIDFQLFVDIINTADAFKLSRLSKCLFLISKIRQNKFQSLRNVYAKQNVIQTFDRNENEKWFFTDFENVL